ASHEQPFGPHGVETLGRRHPYPPGLGDCGRSRMRARHDRRQTVLSRTVMAAGWPRRRPARRTPAATVACPPTILCDLTRLYPEFYRRERLPTALTEPVTKL